MLAVVAILPSQAGTVTVTSKDGGTAITGDLISFDGETYTIRSIIGDVNILAKLADCVGEDCPQIDPLNQKIRSVGSDLLLAKLLPEAIDEFSVQNDAEMIGIVGSEKRMSFVVENGASETLATFDVAGRAPRDSLQALLRDDAEMALMSRRINNLEIDAFLDAGLGNLASLDFEQIVAQDALVIVSSQGNRLGSLSIAQIEGIFSGRINNWSELGGPNAPINVYAPALASGEAEYFFETVLEPEFSDFSTAVQHFDDLNSVADRVAADPDGIGLTSSAAVRTARVVPIGSACGIVVSPNSFAIKSEDYPLSRRLYAYTTNRQLPSRTKQLVQLIQSKRGQQVVQTTGLTSLDAEVTTLNSHGNRLAYSLSDPAQSVELANLREFVGETLKAKRLSVTFRFSVGSSRLDNKAQLDVERLVEELGSDAYVGREILLIGFTDSIGQSSVNKVLSTRRAQQVLDEIAAASDGRLDLSAFQILGFGASSPVACNDTDLERQLNRRVEVWVR